MKRRITALALCLCVIAGTPTALASFDGPRPQEPTYTVKQYKRYASKVYKRKKISHKAKRQLREMVLHQQYKRGKQRVLKIRARLIRQRKAAQCSNSNPRACIYVAARHFGVSAQWLIACANSEGGLGPNDYKKPNNQDSGAYGNFQFMSGTFYSFIRRAGWKARAIWLNARQQAWAAAWAFRNGLSHHWTGRGC